MDGAFAPRDWSRIGDVSGVLIVVEINETRGRWSMLFRFRLSAAGRRSEERVGDTKFGADRSIRAHLAVTRASSSAVGDDGLGIPHASLRVVKKEFRNTDSVCVCVSFPNLNSARHFARAGSLVAWFARWLG